MRIEDYFDFLGPDDIRIHGHRIGIESILDEYVYRHRTPQQIQKRFPTLTLEQVYATILYYLHNRAEAGAYLDDWREHSRQMREEQARNPNPGALKLQQLLKQRSEIRTRAE